MTIVENDYAAIERFANRLTKNKQGRHIGLPLQNLKQDILAC
jgi:hypothetical protein